MKRRVFLKGAGVAGAAFGAGKALGASAGGAEDFYAHENWGVASGEPGETSITIWTRLPARVRAAWGAFEGQGRPSGALPVRWWLAESKDAQSGEPGGLRETGVAFADPSRDDCVKVHVQGLRPGGRYVYWFEYSSGDTSDTGFARTLPPPDSNPDFLRYAYVSCQYFGSGFYTVYQALAQDNVHFCVHLGDSIYESVGKNDRFIHVRPDPIGTAITLVDYRERYKRTLTDPWYREVRRRFTWICLPDDHEFVNDYSRTDPDPAQAERRAAARAAYFEYTPIADALFPSVERIFRFGRLATLVALDERSHRDGPVCASSRLNAVCDAARAPDRTMLGVDQKAWLKNAIASSETAWNVLLSEVLVIPQRVVNRPEGLAYAPFEHKLEHNPMRSQSQETFVNEGAGKDLASDKGKGPLHLSLDAWDGYPAERAELAEFLASRGEGNTLVWTGDIHNCYAGLLRAGGRRPDAGTNAAFEMSTGSVSSYGVGDVFRLGTAALVEAQVRKANEHMVFVDLRRHMYVRVTLSREQALFETVCPQTIARPSSAFSVTGAVRVERQSLAAEAITR